MQDQIVINARFLTQKVTGVQRFAIELSRRLKKLHPTVLFVTPKNIVNHSVAKELDAVIIGSLEGHLWEQIDLPIFLKMKGNPVLLNLANTAPLLYRNKLVTIHDLAFVVNPDWFSKGFRAYYSFLIPKIAANSKSIITVSESVKREIVDILSVPDEKVNVIYNAVDFTKEPPADPEKVKKELPPKYFMAVSSIDPRKNFLLLIQAFKHIQDKEAKLLIVGGNNKSFSAPGLEQAVKSTNNVVSLGYVTDSELCVLYKNATAFIYPSLYEGFGIPNIEAMSFGCPVITSNIDVMKEVCGSAALYVDPLQQRDITAKMDLILSDSNLQEDLRRRGYEQLRRYSWEKSANKLSQLLLATTQK